MKPKTSKNKLNEESDDFFETDFGDRKVSHINQSRMIAIPKMALKNACGTTDGLSMNVSMIQEEDGEKYLKLSPICESNIDEELDEDEEDEDV